MKFEDITSPKVLELSEVLKIDECYAVGILECFWSWVARYRPDGDVSGIRPIVIARAIRYSGDAGLLWDALISCEILDDGDGKRLLVRDWSRHCDVTVRVWLARRGLTFADGTNPDCGIATRIKRMQALGGPIPDAIRREIINRDGGQCRICGTTKRLTVDHIHPISKGGTHALENLRCLCRGCNSARGNREEVVT